MSDKPASVFAKYEPQNYPYRFKTTLHLHSICGGTPRNPKVAEGHIRTKLHPSDDLLRLMVAETMAELGVDADTAVEELADSKVNGFKRNDDGLYIEGRQVKAMLKEASNIVSQSGRVPKEGWGVSRKGLSAFLTEHAFVVEDKIPLGRTDADDIVQRFIHKVIPGKGPISAIQYDEIVYDAQITFTVEADYDFAEEVWAAIWITGMRNGLGASRSQDCGRFTVTEWTPLHEPAAKRSKRVA